MASCLIREVLWHYFRIPGRKCTVLSLKMAIYTLAHAGKPFGLLSPHLRKCPSGLTVIAANEMTHPSPFLQLLDSTVFDFWGFMQDPMETFTSINYSLRGKLSRMQKAHCAHFCTRITRSFLGRPLRTAHRARMGTRTTLHEFTNRNTIQTELLSYCEKSLYTMFCLFKFGTINRMKSN